MEKEIKQANGQDKKVAQEESITRKEALAKAGKYAAFTAVGMMVLLSPKQSQAGSQVTPPGDRGW